MGYGLDESKNENLLSGCTAAAGLGWYFSIVELVDASTWAILRSEPFSPGSLASRSVRPMVSLSLALSKIVLLRKIDRKRRKCLWFIQGI